MSYQAEFGRLQSEPSVREEQQSLKGPGVIYRNEDTQASKHFVFTHKA